MGETKLLRLMALLALMAPGSALAGQCMNSKEIMPLLSNNFGETLAFVRQLPNRNIMEVYANGATASWTVTVLVPGSKLSCVIASGTGKKHLNKQMQALKVL